LRLRELVRFEFFQGSQPFFDKPSWRTRWTSIEASLMTAIIARNELILKAWRRSSPSMRWARQTAAAVAWQRPVQEPGFT